MLYRAIGIMSGSSLDGLDIVFCELEETGGKWTWQIRHSECYAYSAEWKQRLAGAVHLNALDYMLLHADYGHYIGQQVNRFIEEHDLSYQVGIIASHGHTTFHMPPRMTGQLGEGAAIAAETGLPVISDLRALDLAFGGQGAPIVPMGEKLLFGEYSYFLNIGGIANISHNSPRGYIAFDICPANRVMNMLAETMGLSYDEGGHLASSGIINQDLLAELDALDYYKTHYPKSLANDFGTERVYPLIQSYKPGVADALATYVEHIARQTAQAVRMILREDGQEDAGDQRMLVTGGGAFNHFLLERMNSELESLRLMAVAAEAQLASYKEALIMALLGVLRWREETTVMSSVTGARKDSIGGALWMGQGGS